MKSQRTLRLSSGRTGRAIGVLTTIVVTSALLTVVPAFAASAATHQLPSLGKPVPGASAAPVAVPDPNAASSSQNAPAASATLPAAASYEVSTPASTPKSPLTANSVDGVAAATTAGAWSELGTTGINIAPATTTPAGAASSAALGVAGSSVQKLTAKVLDASDAAAHGLTGLVLQLARTDNSTTTAPVAVQIPETLLSGLYGADYAARTRWVQIPATSTDTSQAVQVASTTDTTSNALVVTPQVSNTAILLAPMATPVSTTGTGSFAATSLKSATSWDVSAQTGDFSWTYPMAVPPAAAGPAPALNLTYDSQSVDGETGSSNNQPSAVGDGWSLGGGGFIERTYVSCSQDSGASGPVTTSGDLCWKTDNATISLGGHSGQLVKDATTGVWKLESDDGSRIEHLVGTAAGCAANGTYDTDCWRVTTRDGTQYYFGLNQLPGWASGKATTNSTWTVPVYGNDTGEPCHASTFAASSCVQAWRWNLDYVVDTHGNAEAFYYDTETNKYAQNGTGATSYIRGGQLDHIDYGMTASTVYATNAASDKVAFGYDQYGRCSDTTHANCTTETITSAATAAAHPTSYPDVPFDQFCNGTTCPTLLSPTFWATGMLDTVTTKVLKSGAYSNVDVWTLGHSFPAPGDGTNAALWLTQIGHTGFDGTRSLIEPATLFSGTPMQNRVWVIDGLAPLDKWRLSSITTSTGAVMSVNYSAQECTPAGAATIEAAPQSNTSRCFPQWWTPQIVPAQAASIDLFHKYVVTSVISNPETGGGNDRPQETDYVYTGTPAWRYDTSPFTSDAQKTWSQYAGYNSIEIRVGDSSSPSTQQTTDYTFYQGMDGDRANAAGGTKSVTVTGATGVTDSRWFGGSTRETKVLNGVGGAVISDTINTPWASAVTANDDTNTARLTGQTETVKTEPLSTGGNRTTDTKTTNDPTYGLPLTVDQVTSDAGTTCTTNTYAAANTTAWLIGLPDETASVGVDCSAVPTASFPAAAISDTKTFYDNLAWGAAPTKGEVSSTQIVKGYTGSTAATAQWVTDSQKTYDTMGRPLISIDILGHTITTAYTPAATAVSGSGALTGTTTTNTAPLNWTTSETLDPARGTETSARDQNGKLTTAIYDPLGRRTAVWLPAWPQAANRSQPSTSYAYTESQTSPNAVETTTTIAGQNVTSYTLYDGLGQPVQTQGEAEGGGTVITDTGYDPAGRVNLVNNAYPTSISMSTNLFVPTSEAEILSVTLTTYDGAGRTTATITNSANDERYRTTISYLGADRTDTVPPAGGIQTSTFTNTLGQTTKLSQYQAATITGTPENTTYTYNPSGKMTAMTDPALNSWHWSFDVLGNQTQAIDPDTGTTNSTYDLAGNLLTSTDARGVTLAYSYDALNRKTGQYQTATGSTGSLLASWAYDTLTGGKGQLASSSSYTGSTTGHPGIAYTDATTGYDDNYDPTGETISIPTGAPAFGGTTYTTSMFYYPDGAPTIKNYPAVGGVAAERERFSYDGLGKLTGVSGLSNYDSTVYNAIGQVAENSRDGTTTLYSDYGYDPANNAILNINDDSVTGVTDTSQANRVYTRDNSGNVTSAETTSGTAATDTQCYTYDHLQNLTADWTPTSNSCTATPTTSTIGGPAPIWKSYTFDAATGNRLTVVGHATTSTGVDTSKTYSYPAATAANPHAVTSIAQTTSGVTTNTSYGYDAAGDTTTRPGQTLTYSPTGKLQTVVAGTSTQNSIYDANGVLLLQKDSTNGATLYLGDTQLHQAAGATTTSVVRTYSAGSTPTAERTSAAGSTTSSVDWLGTDVDGTADLEINATTGAVTHRYQDPYGNPRGSAVAWSSPKGYLNDPISSFSGLTQIGARAYDPSIGKFLTVDTVLTPTNPLQNNGYDYSHNNPITLADPTGNKPLGQYDNDWQGNTDQNGGDNSASHIGAHGAFEDQTAPPVPGDKPGVYGDSWSYSDHLGIGKTTQTASEITKSIYQNFGSVFPPLFRMDGSMSSVRLTGVGQVVPTKLLGIDGPLTSGDVTVASMTDTSWSFGADPGHPVYPGSVSFSISVVDGTAYLDVTGKSSAPVPGPGSNLWAYDTFSRFIWSNFAGNINDQLVNPLGIGSRGIG